MLPTLFKQKTENINMNQLDQLVLQYRSFRDQLPLSGQVAFDFITGMIVMRGFVVPACVAALKKVFDQRDRLCFWHFHRMARDDSVARRPFED